MKPYYVATLLSAILIFGGSLLAPVEVRFIESITSSSAVSGAIFGVASIALALLSYYIARLSNRIGRHRTILIGVGVGIVYSLLYASVVNTLGLFGVKFAWAFAIAATNPVLAAYVQSILKDNAHTGRYFGYYYALQSIAGSGGALLGGYVFSTVGFSGVAYVLAGSYALATLIAYFLPRERSFGADTERVVHDHTIFDLLGRIWQKPELRFYLASNISTSLNWGVKPFLWPLVIYAISGSDITTGSIFATMGVVAFVLLPFAGRIADYIGAYRTLAVELFIFAVVGITMALTDDIVIFWIAAAVYTVAEVLNVAQAMVLTKELDDDLRSEAMALDMSFDQILGFLAPIIAGLLITLTSPSTTLLVFMSLYMLSFVVMFHIGRKHRLFTAEYRRV